MAVLIADDVLGVFLTVTVLILTKVVELTGIMTDVLLFGASRVGEVEEVVTEETGTELVVRLVVPRLKPCNVLVTLTVLVRVVVESGALSLTELMTRVDVGVGVVLSRIGSSRRVVAIELISGLREFG